MTSKLDTLKAAMSQLSVAERAELAEFLVRTLDSPEDGPVDEASIRREWLAVAERRAEDLRNGASHAIPAEDVWKGFDSWRAKQQP